MMKVLAIIPARGGSKRIPQKNIKKFLGKEIITYPIEALNNCSAIDKVIVSTDSESIKSVALNAGASVPFMRSERNSDDFATTFEVIKEVVDKLDDEYDLVCCVYPTSVFVTTKVIQEAIRMMTKNPRSTSVATVLEYSHPIQRALRIKDNSLESLHPENYNKRSQDFETIYHDAGQFYLFKLGNVISEKKLITANCLPYIIHPNKAHDIDTQEDWDLAELKFTSMELV